VLAVPGTMNVATSRHLAPAPELREGESLRVALRHGWRPSVLDALCLLRQVCQALIAVHGTGAIHGRIRPRNIVAMSRATNEPQRVVLTGFEAEWEWTACSVDIVDARTDIYSCGILLCELLTGVVPRRVHDVATPALDDDVSSLITRCIAQDPIDRFQTTVQLDCALAAVIFASLSRDEGHIHAYAATLPLGQFYRATNEDEPTLRYRRPDAPTRHIVGTSSTRARRAPSGAFSFVTSQLSAAVASAAACWRRLLQRIETSWQSQPHARVRGYRAYCVSRYDASQVNNSPRTIFFARAERR
jgi:serine/threonine protein kinase